MKKIYEDFNRRNPYGFAHYFICFFVGLFCSIGLLFTSFIPWQWVTVLSVLTMFVGLLSEIKQHGLKWYNVQDSREDMYMNAFGLASGILAAFGMM